MKAPKTLRETLSRTLAGDIDYIRSIYGASPSDLADAAAGLSDRTVTVEAAKKVLARLRRDPASRDDVALWADFVSYGTVGPDGVHAIDFPYDEENEEILAETLFRMRERGDEVVSDLTGTDIDELLAQLG